MKDVLVTGGAGFLGSHLCERLLDSGCRVECWDNLFTGSLNNIRHLMARLDFHFVKCDVIHSHIGTRDYEEIYNLACPAAPGHYQYDPISTMKTCVVGAMKLLELADMCGAKILQASTSEVYGDPTVHPQMESYCGYVNPIGPRACYDEGKRAAETLFMDYHRTKGTKVKIARIFNTYGPRMHPFDGRVVSNFIRQALNDEPITIYGNGRQTRSFCYRDELVDGLIRLMASDITGPVNLGNPHEFMIAELADKVITLTGTNSKVVWKPRPEDDPCRRKPDITLAQDKLDWNPTVYLTEGLIQTIRWFRTINLADYTPPTPSY